MARSDHPDFEEVAAVAADYGLTPTACEPLKGGWNNSSYRLATAGGDHVLTIFEQRSVAATEALGRLLAHLGDHDYPTTRVVSRLDGCGYTRSFRGHAVLVKRFVEGEVVEPPAAGQVRQVGRALARLHDLPPPDFLTRGHSYELDFYHRVLAYPAAAPFAAWLSARKAEFDAAMVPSLPSGMVHGDLFNDNVLFAGEKLQAVIDFEDTCRHVLVFDLAMTLVGMASRESEIDWPRARALVGGYQEGRALEAIERSAFRPAVVWAAAGTACWRYWRFQIHSKSAEHRHRHRLMVSLAELVRRMPEEQWRRALFGRRRASRG